MDGGTVPAIVASAEEKQAAYRASRQTWTDPRLDAPLRAVVVPLRSALPLAARSEADAAWR